MKNFNLILLFSFLLNISLHAQEPFDCITAVNVCGGETSTFVFDSAKGNINEVIPESCFNGGIGVPVDWTKNSIWLKYKFKKEGKFTFTIHPLDDQQDIDFLLVQSQNNNCKNFSVVRCISSGERISMKDSPCLGDTGLNENAEDQSEGPGCYDGFDNFVSAVDVKANEIYYLYISNFATDKLNFSISYGYPELLDCIVSSTENISNISIAISPNPTTHNFTISSSSSQTINYQILDSMGKMISTGSFSNQKTIITNNMNSGLYFLKFIDAQSSITTKKLLILK